MRPPESCSPDSARGNSIRVLTATDSKPQIAAGEVTVPFTVDDYTRWRLMEGLDDIGLTLQQGDSIDTYETTRPAWFPTTA